MRRLISIGVLLALIAIPDVMSLRLLGGGGAAWWSSDKIFNDGRDGPMIDMRLQLGADPYPPAVGIQRLLFRVKDISGYPISVNRVSYTVSKDGGDTIGAGEALPIGEFGVKGRRDGVYLTNVQIPSLGRYQVFLRVRHGAQNFEANWPLEVDAR